MRQIHNYYPDNNEIDLFELISRLYREKRTILLSTMVFSLLAISIAYLLPKTYQAEAILSPANPSQLNSIKIITSQLNSNYAVSPESVFDDFEKQLTSQYTLEYVFQNTALAAAAKADTNSRIALTLAKKEFKKNLSIHFDKTSNTPRISIKYNATNQDESARVINELLIPYAQEVVLKTIKENIDASAVIAKKRLDIEIRRLESNFKSNNQLRITELNEALDQAIAAGIPKADIQDISPTLIEEAAYLLGEKILRSRIKLFHEKISKYKFYTQNSPESDDLKPYIRGVADKIYQLERLDQLTVDYSQIQPVLMEQEAVPPAIAIKPKKSIIGLIGIILGGMIGLFIALMKIAVQNRRERIEQAGQQLTTMTDLSPN